MPSLENSRRLINARLTQPDQLNRSSPTFGGPLPTRPHQSQLGCAHCRCSTPAKCVQQLLHAGCSNQLLKPKSTGKLQVMLETPALLKLGVTDRAAEIPQGARCAAVMPRHAKLRHTQITDSGASVRPGKCRLAVIHFMWKDIKHLVPVQRPIHYGISLRICKFKVNKPFH